MTDRVRGSLHDRLPKRWVIMLALSWPLLITLGTVIEPSPADPDAADTLVGNLLVLWFVVALLATVVGLALRRRWGATASFLGAISLFAATILCPVSGHHTGLGAWWFGQLTIAGTLAGLSRRALRASITAHP